MEPIDSIKDDRIARARALATRPGRLAAGRCLIEGAALIAQVVASGAGLDYVLCPAGTGAPELAAALAKAAVPVYEVRQGLLRKVTGSAKPPGWLAVAVLPGESAATEPYGDFAVVCERVADPGNLGTIVRSARALGVRDVVLTDAGTDLSSRRALEAARGAVLDCRIRRFTDPVAAVTALRAAGFQVVATSPRGSHLPSLAPLRGRRVALVAGNETDGVSAATEAAADLVVQIPMAGAVESLNVAVATGIGIYELRMRMILTMLTDRIRDTLGRNLAVAAHLTRRAFDTRLGQLGNLGSDQAIALMVLACERSTPAGRLRRDLGVDAAELEALLAALRERGYVTAGQDEASITTAGEQAVAALWAVQEGVEEDLYDGFSPAERDQFRDLLRRVQDNAADCVRVTAADPRAAQRPPGDPQDPG